MLKIVVFDSGYGGELFASRLESELPVAEIIRITDWRGADTRKVAENVLAPYIGKVDLIILANYLLSATSLNYFRRKYKNQKFVGFSLRCSRMVVKKSTLILTTSATAKCLTFFTFAHRIRAKTICLDSWPLKINDACRDVLDRLNNFSPEQILLACGQLSKFIPEFREVFGHNVRIVDSFDDAIRDTYRILNIRGVPKLKS